MSWRGLLAAASVVGVMACGGSSKRATTVPTLSSKAVAPPTGPGTSVVLYRGGAWVQVRRNVDVLAGRSTFEVALPLDVQDVTVLGTGSSTLVSTSMWSDDKKLSAKLAEILADSEGLALGSFLGDGTIGFSDLEELPKSEDSKVVITLDSARAGKTLVEFTYWTTELRWSVGYNVFTSGGKGAFSGALVVHQPSGIDLGPVSLTLVDAAAPGKKQDDDDDDGDDDSSSGSRTRSLASADLKAALLVDSNVNLVGESTRIQLPGASEDVEVREVLVLDATGTKLDRRVAVPYRDKKYGIVGVEPAAVEQSYEFATPTALRGDLPQGTLRMFERVGVQVRPVASLIVGNTPPPEKGETASITVPVGAVSSMTAKRSQTMFSLDGKGKSLTEEITIELTNKGDRSREVLVREHLYRGLTWSLPYFSSPPVKEGDQQVAMRVQVPARGKAKLTYRVTYKWGE